VLLLFLDFVLFFFDFIDLNTSPTRRLTDPLRLRRPSTRSRSAAANSAMEPSEALPFMERRALGGRLFSTRTSFKLTWYESCAMLFWWLESLAFLRGLEGESDPFELLEEARSLADLSGLGRGERDEWRPFLCFLLGWCFGLRRPGGLGKGGWTLRRISLETVSVCCGAFWISTREPLPLVNTMSNGWNRVRSHLCFTLRHDEPIWNFKADRYVMFIVVVSLASLGPLDGLLVLPRRIYS